MEDGWEQITYAVLVSVCLVLSLCPELQAALGHQADVGRSQRIWANCCVALHWPLFEPVGAKKTLYTPQQQEPTTNSHICSASAWKVNPPHQQATTIPSLHWRHCWERMSRAHCVCVIFIMSFVYLHHFVSFFVHCYQTANHSDHLSLRLKSPSSSADSAGHAGLIGGLMRSWLMGQSCETVRLGTPTYVLQDYKKAYDLMLHSWILECLKLYNINRALRTQWDCGRQH